MPKASPVLSSFNSGELSPLVAGRTDLKYYPNGCRRMRNFIPTRQGPARRRGGTRFVAEVKNSANRTWLARFQSGITSPYVMEFGDLYIRFFANHGVVGAPFEVVTPYTAANLINSDGAFAIRFAQSGDTLYMVHPSYAPRVLTRTGAATFSIATLTPDGGPFDDLNEDPTLTVWCNANTGNGKTLTASAAIFQAGHVGSLFYLEQKEVAAIPMWEPGKARVINDVRRSDGKNYHALNNATTGTITPTHSHGALYDGDAGVQWQYDDPGYGWCKITAIGGGGTTATVDILSRIPDGAVGAGNPSTRWAYGSWSDVNGWPDKVTFNKERLCFGRGRLVWQSVSGDFTSFKDRDDNGLVVDDSAITSDITSDQANNIQWFAPSDQALLVGTAGDETAMSEITQTQPLSPTNVQARKQAEYGSRNIQPVRVGDGILFVQRSGRKVRELTFSWEKDGYVAPDTTVLSEHVTYSGIVGMTFQQEPDPIVWCHRADGMLIGFTLDREQDVHGWHPHRIGGYADVDHRTFAIVESCVAIPAPANDRDELWMIVRRYVNGQTKRYVEWMEKYHERGADPSDAFYVDCGLTLHNTKNAILTPGANATVEDAVGVNFNAPGMFVAGDVGRKIHYRYSTTDVKGTVTWIKSVAEITAFVDANNVTCTINVPFPSLTPIAANGWSMTTVTVSGMNHAVGETVQVWADGASHPDRVVNGAGQITLQYPASKVHVGWGAPAVLQPMPIEAGAADGTARGKKQRAHRVGIMLDQTIGIQYGRDEDEQLDRVETRDPADSMDEAPPLFDGVVTVSWPDGHDDTVGALITLIADQPGPACIVGIIPHLTTEDSR